MAEDGINHRNLCNQWGNTSSLADDTLMKFHMQNQTMVMTYIFSISFKKLHSLVT